MPQKQSRIPTTRKKRSLPVKAKKRVRSAPRRKVPGEVQHQAVEKDSTALHANITALKQVEHALRNSEERFRAIYEHGSLGIALGDLQGRFYSANPAFHRMLGYDEGELVGRNFRQLTNDEDLSVENSLIQELIAGKREHYEMEKRYIRKDGRLIWITISTSLLRDSKGIPTLGLAMVQDITALKRIEEALRSSEERFRAIYEHGSMGIALCDLQGTVTLANPAFHRLLGYDEGELTGKNFRQFTRDEDLPVEYSLIEELIAEKRKYYEMEKRYIKKDGRLIWITISVSLLRDSKGMPTFGLAMAQDITARKQAEEVTRQHHEQLLKLSEELAATEERERKRIVEELHDRIGQNLNAIGLDLDIIRSGLSSRESELMSRINDASTILEQTIERTRNLMGELRPPGLDDFGLIAAFKWLLQSFTARTGIEAELNDNEGLPRLAPDKEILIFRVVQEALNNVSKHAQATYVNVAITAEDDRITIIVSDNGKGFEPEEILTAQGMNGWGIMHMRERCRIVGGTWRIDSKPGAGTSVVVEFPK